MKTCFITGTDTDIGKTYVSVLLMKKLISLGWTVQGIKPIASGCNKQKKNEDALQLQQNSSRFYPYSLVNPILFEQPIAPHIAADHLSQSLSKAQINTAINNAMKLEVDYLFIEGCGGWMIPLNQIEHYCDVIIEMKIPVILIVGMKLGCL